MDKYERIFQLHRLLSGRRTPMPVVELMERLEDCSRATLYRDFAFLRDVLDAPIEHDRDAGGVLYRATPDGRSFELPGLWFSAAELQALVTFRELLATLGPGLLEEHLAPLSGRIGKLINHRRLRLDELPRRIRLLGGLGRSPGKAFHAVASTVLQRHRLRFHYHSRSRDQHTERDVSPQRLVHYRDNWYLDAWDHGRNALRTFALDRISKARTSEESARNVPEDELDKHFGSAYGIFSGTANKVALLRFSPERARWVADEHWHPDQSGQFLTDGRYELRVPYRHSPELVLEILRHGAEVEVVEPEELRAEIAEELRKAARRYARGGEST